MNSNYLDFEQPIAELQAKIDELRNVGSDNAINLDEEIQRLQSKMRTKIKGIFKDLSPWQISQLSRHPLRPYTLDYVSKIFEEFHELHGDRAFADDHAIVGGLARFRGRPIVFIGQQKGRDTKAKVFRNFGMPRPEGYRKAMRLMNMAARFHLPLITFIDTPGAYPGVGAEERGERSIRVQDESPQALRQLRQQEGHRAKAPGAVQGIQPVRARLRAAHDPRRYG